MTPYPKKSSKARMGFKMDRIFVFTTRITLNERFSRKLPRHVFVSKNGFTASHKNNSVKGRIAFPRRNTGANKMISSCSEGDFQKNKRRKACRRPRSVLMATNLENQNDVECSQNERLPTIHSRCYYFSSYKPSLNTGRYRYLSQQFYQPFYKRAGKAPVFPSWYSPGKYRFTHQLPYKWRRKQITKAQLDDEIDRYMAEVKLKPITIATKEEDAMSTSTTELYLRETEKYLKESEDSDWPAF